MLIRTARLRGLFPAAPGRYEEAEETLRKALEIQKQGLAPDHPEVCQTLNELALPIQYQGRLEEAEKVYQETIRCFRHRAGTAHPSYGIALSNRAAVLSMLNRLEEAAAIAEEALEIKLETLGEDHPTTAQSLVILGNLRFKLKDIDGAIPHYQRSRGILVRLLGEADVRTTFASMGLARAFCQKRNHSEAQELFSQALEVRSENLPEGDYLIADAAAALGDCLGRHQGKPAEGLPYLRQSYPVYVRQFGPDHPRTQRIKGFVDAVEAKLR